jgi:predicted 2-oxoglutarate/Fe(II)-dependent dioxygenase YbiX
MTKKFIAQLHGRIIIIVAIAVIFAWSPWITDEYATTAVVEFLDGPDQNYNYLGDLISLRDLPKTVVRVPFGDLVYFPSEAMYIVAFWGRGII